MYVDYINVWNFTLKYVQTVITENKLQEGRGLQLLLNDISAIYRVAQKWHSFWYAWTSSNINRFWKLFHCQNQEKMCNNTITKDPTTPQECRLYTFTLWNVKCLQSNNWKQDGFCNNTFFYKIKDREQRVYCLSYCLK